jgi:hypothetical protein
MSVVAAAPEMADIPALEDPISNLTLMASVTCTIMEGFAENLAVSRGMTGASVEKLVISIEGDFEELAFCIYQLNSMTKDLSKLYYSRPGVAA